MAALSSVAKKVANRFRKKYSSIIGKRYLDIGFRERDTTIVAGTARSGTTWIGNVIAYSTKSRLIFEPFLLNKNMEFVIAKKKEIDENQLIRNFQLYIPCHHEYKSKNHKEIEKILSGRIRATWSEKQARRGIFQHRVIKEIRANLFLGYIARNWPNIKIVLVIRNPFSVVNSLITKTKKGWGFNWDIGDAFSQPRLMQDWLQPFSDWMGKTNGLAERFAHKWCIETLIALHQTSDLENVRVIRYERLAKRVEEWRSLANFFSDYAWSESLFLKHFDIPSFTTERKPDQLFRGIDSHAHLDAEKKSAIRKIVNIYGLEQFLVE